jgi:hypothetical protein
MLSQFRGRFLAGRAVVAPGRIRQRLELQTIAAVLGVDESNIGVGPQVREQLLVAAQLGADTGKLLVTAVRLQVVIENAVGVDLVPVVQRVPVPIGHHVRATRDVGVSPWRDWPSYAGKVGTAHALPCVHLTVIRALSRVVQ